jgi:hypothetical protein
VPCHQFCLCCQQHVICEFNTGGGGERKLAEDKVLSLAFSERQTDKKIFLFVDVVDVSNVVLDNASASVHSSNEPVVARVINWDIIEIVLIPENQIGTAAPVMVEDAMYAFVGLRAEDERAEKDRLADEKNVVPIDLRGAELLVNDCIPSEDSIFYDKEDPLMKVGSTYACMDEFRAIVRQHAITGQFELGTEKSCKDRFRGYCKAEGCQWCIVARLMQDGKQVRVHFVYFSFFFLLYLYT